MKACVVEEGISLYGPYTMVAPDAVTGASFVKALTFSGVV